MLCGARRAAAPIRPQRAVNVGDRCDGVHHQIIVPVGAVEGPSETCEGRLEFVFRRSSIV
ncbi:hypothetical protein DEA98_24590 [Brucella pseudogrignonensis]|nr:hypothetical protein [Brucella pseudogrignonensis]